MMRLHAYKEALKEAMKLTENVEKLSAYFEDNYSPKTEAVNYILKKTRNDEALYDHEFVALYNALEDIVKAHN